MIISALKMVILLLSGVSFIVIAHFVGKAGSIFSIRDYLLQSDR